MKAEPEVKAEDDGYSDDEDDIPPAQRMKKNSISKSITSLSKTTFLNRKGDQGREKGEGSYIA